MDSLNGEEKKDASKEDLEQEEGRADNLFDFAELFENLKEENGKRSQIRKRFLSLNVNNDNWNYVSIRSRRRRWRRRTRTRRWRDNNSGWRSSSIELSVWLLSRKLLQKVSISGRRWWCPVLARLGKLEIQNLQADREQIFRDCRHHHDSSK